MAVYSHQATFQTRTSSSLEHKPFRLWFFGSDHGASCTPREGQARTTKRLPQTSSSLCNFDLANHHLYEVDLPPAPESLQTELRGRTLQFAYAGRRCFALAIFVSRLPNARLFPQPTTSPMTSNVLVKQLVLFTTLQSFLSTRE